MDYSPEELDLAGGRQVHDIECIPFIREKHIRVDSNSIVSVTSEIHTYSNGSKSFFFTDSPESATLNLIHGFTSSFLQSGVINPATTFSSKTGQTQRSFPAHTIFGPISMAEVLNLAGLSLESRNVQPWIRGGDPASSPFYRLSGVVLLLRIQYSNLREYEFAGSPNAGRPQAEVTAEALQKAWGFAGSEQRVDPATGAQYTVSRNGIRVQLILTGRVGQFDPMQVVRRLLEGVVLLSVAAISTEAVARRVLYRRAYDGLTSEVVPGPHPKALERVAKGGGLEPGDGGAERLAAATNPAEGPRTAGGDTQR
jgi:hypothetical protein